MNGPLHGIRVAEHASGACPLPLRLAMALTGRLAAGLGAQVHKIGTPAQDPVRTTGPRVGDASALSTFLDVGKSWRADPLEVCDIVLCDDTAFAQPAAGAAARVRTVFSVFPHGVADAPGASSEFTIMASTGLLDLVGDPAREPLRMGGHQLAYACGLAAYAGSVAALCSTTGGGQEVVRVSLADVAVWLNWKSVAAPAWSGSGRARLGRDAEWQVVRCADGWMALVFLEADWPVLRDFVDDARLRDARYDDRITRRSEARRIAEIVEAAFLRYTRRELKDMALARRLPLGPVWTPIELETDPQNTARGFFSRTAVPGADSAVLMPRLPVLWNNRAYPA